MHITYRTPQEFAALVKAGTIRLTPGMVLTAEQYHALGYRPGDDFMSSHRTPAEQKKVDRLFANLDAKEMKAASLDAAAAAAVAPGATAARLQKHFEAQLADLYARLDAPGLSQGTGANLESFWALQEQLGSRNLPISMALDPGLRARFHLNGGNLDAALDPAQPFPMSTDPARQPRRPGLATDAPGSGARHRLKPLLRKLGQRVQDALGQDWSRETMRQLLADLRALNQQLDDLITTTRHQRVAA
jgi:hypothetical protein